MNAVVLHAVRQTQPSERRELRVVLQRVEHLVEPAAREAPERTSEPVIAVDVLRVREDLVERHPAVAALLAGEPVRRALAAAVREAALLGAVVVPCLGTDHVAVAVDATVPVVGGLRDRHPPLAGVALVEVKPRLLGGLADRGLLRSFARVVCAAHWAGVPPAGADCAHLEQDVPPGAAVHPERVEVCRLLACSCGHCLAAALARERARSCCLLFANKVQKL